MDTKQAQLYAKIVAFEFDEPGTCRTFSARLAEENGWSEDFAARAVFEYRRFLFLAMAASHAVCPSEEVDEVWHLHLIYSRSYWQRLCGEVLERPLHHDPSRGGGAEYAKHRSMYERTLDDYRRLFGEEPPGDLWPDGAERFSPRRRSNHTAADHYWMIRKPWLWLSARAWWQRASRRAAVAAMAILPLPLIGVAVDHPFDLRGPEFLQFYAAVLLIAFLLAVATRVFAKHSPQKTVHTLPLDAHQVAYLSGGLQWAAKTALAQLVAEREVIVIRTRPLRLGRFGEVKAEGNALECALHRQMPKAPEGASWGAVCRNANTAVAEVGESLRERGLVMSATHALVAHWGPLMIMGAALLIGAIKVLVGLQRHRPVGYLMIMVVIATIVSLMLFARRVHRTDAGDQKLLSLKLTNRHLREEARQASFSASESLPLAVALYGFSVLLDGPHKPLALSLDPCTVSDPRNEKYKFWGHGCGGGGVGCTGVIAICGGGGHGCSGGCSGGGGGGCGGGGCGGGGCGGCGI
ncbi:MAG TPA: TIGR04222 domain-containing membrane protein [Pirellulales bacterium]|jgi:uncharacterized protein (TIGR04222 family)